MFLNLKTVETPYQKESLLCKHLKQETVMQHHGYVSKETEGVFVVAGCVVADCIVAGCIVQACCLHIFVLS
jgi:hypothetical protein